MDVAREFNPAMLKDGLVSYVIIDSYIYIHATLNVEPSDNGPFQVEDTIEITSLQRTPFRVPNAHFPIFLIHSEPLNGGQRLYKGQNGWPQLVLCLEVPLYIL